MSLDFYRPRRYSRRWKLKALYVDKYIDSHKCTTNIYTNAWVNVYSTNEDRDVRDRDRDLERISGVYFYNQSDSLFRHFHILNFIISTRLNIIL